MKKYASIAIICAILATIGSTEAAKYKVNTSGTVKNSSGQVITSPANSTNQNYYNNYYTQNYIASNQGSRPRGGICGQSGERGACLWWQARCEATVPTGVCI